MELTVSIKPKMYFADEESNCALLWSAYNYLSSMKVIKCVKWSGKEGSYIIFDGIKIFYNNKNSIVVYIGLT